jgi:hypothetical protein
MEAVQVAVEDLPAPTKWLDYDEIATLYNTIAIGQAVKIKKVYNVTLFRQAIERRGLSSADVHIYQRGSCYIERKSDTPMQMS